MKQDSRFGFWHRQGKVWFTNTLLMFVLLLSALYSGWTQQSQKHKTAYLDRSSGFRVNMRLSPDTPYRFGRSRDKNLYAYLETKGGIKTVLFTLLEPEDYEKLESKYEIENVGEKLFSLEEIFYSAYDPYDGLRCLDPQSHLVYSLVRYFEADNFYIKLTNLENKALNEEILSHVSFYK